MPLRKFNSKYAMLSYRGIFELDRFLFITLLHEGGDGTFSLRTAAGCSAAAGLPVGVGGDHH